MLQFVLEFIKLMLIMHGLLSYKIKNKKKVLAIFFMVAFLSFFAFDVMGIYLENKSIILWLIVTVFIIFSIEGKHKISVTIVAYIVLCLIEMILAGLIIVFFDINMRQLYQYDVVDIFENAICIILLVLICFLMNQKKRRVDNTYLGTKLIWIIGVSVTFQGILLAGVQLKYLQMLETGRERELVIMLPIGIIFFIIISFIAIVRTIEKKRLREQYVVNEELLEKQQEYYQELLQKDYEMRRFRHDINSHLSCMYELFEKERHTELKEYFQKLIDDVEKNKIEVQTGNDIVNAIVADILKNNGNVKIEWNGKIASTVKIKLVDICTIFSNLLRNAVEAVIQIPNGGNVEVEIRYFNKNMIVLIKNPVYRSVEILDNKMWTEKRDRINHGLGTINVEQCVKKYDGKITYVNENHLFETKIILPNVI